MPDLVLGPMLRYVDENNATIWVETSEPCEVALHGTPGIEGATARTFEVRGQHYALVVASGLMPATEYEYQVSLDGAPCWPLPSPSGDPLPPSVFVTPGGGRSPRIVFGSCRNSGAPETTSYGPDALEALASDLAPQDPDTRPDALLLIGDQVYSDGVSGEFAEFLASRRAAGSSRPAREAVGFAEYSALYREAWTPPQVRWLLSVVPTVMIFDDHDLHDDWNTSAAWRAEFQSQPWWRERLTGAFGSYWLYQHLGNLSPDQLDADETCQRVLRCTGDAGDILEDLALRADRLDPGVRWSVRRDVGGVRVVVIDSRSRRVVEDSPRRMADEAEWAWVTESVTGDFDHVVLATSVPPLLPRGIDAMERWSERVCAGSWGSWFARFGERLRQKVDLEHWPSFDASFTEFENLLCGLVAGSYGTPPATVTVISGDVHHSYLSPVHVPRPDGTGPETAVWSAVCSPIRNLMSDNLRRAYALAASPPGAVAASAAAWLIGARRPRIRWKTTAGPWFSNMLATLDYDGRSTRLRFDRSSASGLETVHESPLTAE